jgi:putative ubiquitin-RnfH superfamily antitoxin RatB of RatAB toxin-antitoxin module
MEAEERSISVVYALADRQEIVKLAVASTTTVAEAVEQSGLLQRFPEIAAQPLRCAVYARVVELTSIVGEGDRIEILRPLLIDPKENRRQVAAAAKKTT